MSKELRKIIFILLSVVTIFLVVPGKVFAATNQESSSEEYVLIEDRYYVPELQTSGYAYDTTEYSANGTVVTVNANWSETPHFDVENGTIRVGIVSEWTDEFVYQGYYTYNSKKFSIDIDLFDYDDGKYWLLLYPNNECAIDDIYLYKHAGEIYFAGALSDVTYCNRYDILRDKIEQLNPDMVHSNYMNSAEAILNKAQEGQDAYIKAHEVVAGCSDDYEQARKIYEWIEANYSVEQGYEAQGMMVAMLNAVGIPAIKTRGTSYRWIYFYCDGRWCLSSPYMVLVGNNIGYFDTDEMCALWDLGGERADIVTIKPMTYSVYFMGNGSTSGWMSGMWECEYGTSYMLNENAFKRTGYTFTGWNTKANGSGTTYKNKASVKNLTSSDGKTVTLYAQWKKTKYKITYKLNGGKNNSKNPGTFYVTSSTIALKKPTRKGYEFGGWYSDSKYNTKVTKITKGSTGNKTLYAKWIKKKI